MIKPVVSNLFNSSSFGKKYIEIFVGVTVIKIFGKKTLQLCKKVFMQLKI